MQVLSKFLNKNLEFQGYEIEGGKKIISHNELEDIIINQCKDVSFTYVPVEHFKAPVFICKMYNADKTRVIEAIGEGEYKSLTTEIARHFPATMAANRAFDRAAIRFLGLSGKVYSDNEIEKSSVSDTSIIEDERSMYTPNEFITDEDFTGIPTDSQIAELAKAEEEIVPEVSEIITSSADIESEENCVEPTSVSDTDSDVVIEDDLLDGCEPIEDEFDNIFNEELSDDFISDDSDNDTAEEETASQEETITQVEQVELSNEEPIVLPDEEPTVSETVKTESSEIEGADLIVALGRNKNKNITFKELAEKDIDSLKWIANYSPRFDKDKIQVETAKRMLEAMKEGVA